MNNSRHSTLLQTGQIFIMVEKHGWRSEEDWLNENGNLLFDSTVIFFFFQILLE